MHAKSFFTKILIIFTALGLVIAFAYYEKNKYYNMEGAESAAYVLKNLPNFQAFEILTSKNINSLEQASMSNGLFVHIWGTWCAPCEKEMPDFLEYAAKLKEKNIQFLLVAVNDEEAKIRKFLVRFKTIPSNVHIVLDKENVVMDLFGTLKVPETFLFNKEGVHLNKFVGPQEWNQESYITRLDFWLNQQNQADRKIETH